MNIKERIANDKKRCPNGETTNVSFKHKEIYTILKKLKKTDDLEFREFARLITEKL